MADDQLISRDEAAEVIGVEPDRIDAMVEEGLLTVQADGGDARFARSEVEALRHLGG